MCPGSRATSSPRARSHSQTVPVAAGRGQARAVGVEGHREDLVGVPAQHLARAAVDLPQADGAVQAARGEEAAVGTEGGLEDELLVAAESGGRLVRPRIQEEHGLLVRRQGGQPAAVGAVGQGPALGREQPLAGRDVADVQVVFRALQVERRRGHPPFRPD